MFFSGPNGSGKSNILEAVFFLSYAKSFRTNIAGHLVQHGCDVSLVSAEYEDDLGLEHTMLASIGKKKRFLLMTRKSKHLFRLFGLHLENYTPKARKNLKNIMRIQGLWNVPTLKI